MPKRIKAGRRAVDDRARAARWVKLYRLAQASPDGRYCLNPHDEVESHAYIDETDPEPLLEALESFVEHGTFAVMHDLEPLILRLEMNALRFDGMTYEVALEQLAKLHKISESTIARRISRPVKS